MSPQPVLSALLVSQVLLRLPRVVEVILPPPVRFTYGARRGEQEVDAVIFALIVELPLQLRMLETAPADDSSAHALRRRLRTIIGVVEYPVHPTAAAPVPL